MNKRSANPSNLAFDPMQHTREVARRLSALINHAQSNERDLKKFFDEYPGALPTFWELNHGVHFNFIFPEFRIGPRFRCDYMYLTKSSGEWWCVLVEIESPRAKLFRNGGKDVRNHSDLTNALGQIEDWRDYLDKNRDAFVRSIEPVLFPLSMAKNPLRFKFALVLGRTGEFRDDPRKAARLASLNESLDTNIMTYDSTLSAFRQEHLILPYSNRSLVVARGERFRFRTYTPEKFQSFWWYLKPGQIELTPEQVDLAERAGMRARDWVAGKELPMPSLELREIFPDLARSS